MKETVAGEIDRTAMMALRTASSQDGQSLRQAVASAVSVYVSMSPAFRKVARSLAGEGDAAAMREFAREVDAAAMRFAARRGVRD